MQTGLYLNGLFQKAANLRVSGQEALDPTPQVAVIAASLVEISSAFCGSTLVQGSKEDGFGRRLVGHGPDSE
jgi:hypothetical protein